MHALLRPPSVEPLQWGSPEFYSASALSDMAWPQVRLLTDWATLPNLKNPKETFLELNLITVFTGGQGLAFKLKVYVLGSSLSMGAGDTLGCLLRKALHFSCCSLIVWLVQTTVSTIPWWVCSCEFFFLYEMRAQRCWFEERQIKPKHKIAKKVIALFPVGGEQWSPTWSSQF